MKDWIWLILIPIGILLIFSWVIIIQRKYPWSKALEGIMKPVPTYLLWILPVSILLQRHVPSFRQPSESTCRELRTLFPTLNPVEIYTSYMIQQLSRFLGTAVTLLMITILMLPEFSGEQKVEGELIRPTFLEGEQETTLIAKADGETVYLNIPMEPMSPNIQETTAILDEAGRKLRKEFSKLREIHRSMQLPTQYDEVEITYDHSEGLINSAGHLRLPSGSREYRILRFQAILEYQNESITVDLELLINTMTEESLYSQVIEAIEKNQNEERILLPSSVMVNGKKTEVTYFRPGNLQLFYLVIVGLVLFPLLMIRLGKEQIQEERKKRKEKIHQRFPYIAEKLAIYLGAGMGLQEAWGRTSMEGNDQDPLVQEMRLTYQQMKSGISLPEAMAQLGNRTESSDLKKLVGILSRNIRRGDEYLLENMNNLNHEAWQQHRRDVRIRMEKMQTKILFPMLLMMAVVLVLILTPAVLSMNLS